MEREPIDWSPREYRRGVSLVGSASRGDGGSVRVLVTNLSYAGCQLQSDQALTRGEMLQLRLPNVGDMNGQVRWVSDVKCGIRFLVGASAKDERRARLGV
jgi:hypothetical protein